jgi:glycosyltransferase involved in cell wall biosynthesis
VVVDQLNAGWYGVFAIEAMALGKPVLTFLHEEAARRTEEAFGVPVPIVNVTKETLTERLRPLVESAEERRRIGLASRAYAEEVHGLERMTDRLLALYAEVS